MTGEASEQNVTEKFLDSLPVRYTRDNNGRIEVQGDLDLSNRGLEKLPDLSNVAVTGNFSCAGNRLASLEGCPQDVGGFSCAGNLGLKSLEFSPRLVKGDFDCSGCHLASLDGITNVVFGNFDCSRNDLSSLEKGPGAVGGNYHCQENRLATLKGAPEKIDGDFWCQKNNLPSMEFGPAAVRGAVYSYGNPGMSRDNLPDEYGRAVTDDPRADEQEAERKRLAKLAAGDEKPATQAPAEVTAPPPASITPASITPAGSRPETPAAPLSVAPEEPSPETGYGGSSFLAKAEAERLKAMHLKISQHLNISGIDENHIQVKDARVDEKQQLHLRLGNDRELVCGRNPDGSEFIGAARAEAPFERKDAEAAVSLAASRGWKSINLQGSNEHKALLFLEAERQGLSVANPPPEAVVTRLRQQQEALAAPTAPAIPTAPAAPTAPASRVASRQPKATGAAM